ncbi:UNVERIFIED_CONTAM: hypothetical protein ITH83_25475, partial [Salmonella enterica subsp. enterica serovar Weltevreden]
PVTCNDYSWLYEEEEEEEEDVEEEQEEDHEEEKEEIFEGENKEDIIGDILEASIFESTLQESIEDQSLHSEVITLQGKKEGNNFFLDTSNVVDLLLWTLLRCMW